MKKYFSLLLFFLLLIGCKSNHVVLEEDPEECIPEVQPDYVPSITETNAAAVLKLSPPVELIHCESPFEDGASICALLKDVNGKEYPFAQGPIFFGDTRLYKGANHFRSGTLIQSGSEEEKSLVALLYYWFNRNYTPKQQAALQEPDESDKKVTKEERSRIWKAILCRHIILTHVEKSDEAKNQK
jgi:hypothetical protein